ncbi:hypothetical protein FN846DRAFT_890931 [Sphaerosporella brunnea]|uniref:Uncharacterized protein n=1 Tax=Sphaerosporella brunnea TaxID=1250544 RepID=A0A5J5EV55_9PEZI|nr:hypothetical protein FN846DRAFT_890931 [Sphaerosporella brunnea]
MRPAATSSLPLDPATALVRLGYQLGAFKFWWIPLFSPLHFTTPLYLLLTLSSPGASRVSISIVQVVGLNATAAKSDGDRCYRQLSVTGNRADNCGSTQTWSLIERVPNEGFGGQYNLHANGEPRKLHLKLLSRRASRWVTRRKNYIHTSILVLLTFVKPNTEVPQSAIHSRWFISEHHADMNYF